MPTLKKRPSGPYRTRFTPLYCCFLGFRLLPLLVYHFVWHPYRQSVPVIGFTKQRVTARRRGRDALYDSLFTFLLKCQEKLTGRLLHRATGQLLSFLSAVMSSFDLCFEKRLRAGASLAFSDILAEASVQEKLNVLRSFLQLFDVENPIIDHLRQMFTEHYETYIASLKETQREVRFEDVFACAHFDSGLELSCLMELAALFNGEILDEHARNEFYLFGMLGKFADDWIDITRDMREGSPNLLYALLSQVPEELAALKAQGKQKKPLKARWWRRSCPRAYARYFEYIEHYYQQIQLLDLRLVCDLVMLPVVVGFDYDAPRWE